VVIPGPQWDLLIKMPEENLVKLSCLFKEIEYGFQNYYGILDLGQRQYRWVISAHLLTLITIDVQGINGMSVKN
jgi:hypothetical protein